MLEWKPKLITLILALAILAMLVSLSAPRSSQHRASRTFSGVSTDPDGPGEGVRWWMALQFRLLPRSAQPVLIFRLPGPTAGVEQLRKASS